MHGARNLPLFSVGSQKFTENNRTHAGGQPTLHPHPRVTAVAKTRNRRAACPLPQLSGRGIFRKIRLPYAGSKRARDLRSCARPFDFVRVAHFAQTVSADRAGRSAITRTTNFQLPTSNFQLPTSNFQLPTSNFQLPTSNFQLPTSNFQLPT